MALLIFEKVIFYNLRRIKYSEAHTLESVVCRWFHRHGNLYEEQRDKINGIVVQQNYKVMKQYDTFF